MSEFIELRKIDEAAQVVRERIDIHPRVGMIPVSYTHLTLPTITE